MKRTSGLFEDNKGEIEGLPLELMVISVVMLLSIPLIWSFADMYAEKQAEENLKRELKKLEGTMDDLETLGRDNQRVVSLDIEEDPMARLKYVRLGGDNVRDQSAIRYRFEGEIEKRFSLEDTLAANFTGDEPNSIGIPMDGTSIILKNREHGDSWIIEVSVGRAGT